MSIIFHEKTRVFHISNNQISYLLHIMENEQVENLYFGKRIHDKEDYFFLHEERERGHMVISLPEPSKLSMQYVRQEFPVYGTGDFRTPACTILQEDGSRIMNFKYVSHAIFPGKPLLEGLPATYTEKDEEAETLEICLFDE